ncbi:MAG: hypothetical protein ACRDXF_00330 [Acidimicrobiia bacterium]
MRTDGNGFVFDFCDHDGVYSPELEAKVAAELEKLRGRTLHEFVDASNQFARGLGFSPEVSK